MSAEDRDGNSLPDHILKGNIVEQIVRELHTDDGVITRSNVWLPSKRNPRRKRQIDVLVTGNVLGYERHVAFECKNYGKRIGIGKVGEFFDRLKDTGIPPQHGILIASPNGFTADALDRAKELGIRTFILDGLSVDRITTEVFSAFQSVVYLMLSVVQVRLTSETDLAGATNHEMHFLRDDAGVVCGSVPDLIWAAWRDGEIPTTLGISEFTPRIPPSWSWITGGVRMRLGIRTDVQVKAYVVTHEGTAERVVLKDAQTGAIDRVRINSAFDVPRGTFPLQTAHTEEELALLLKRPAVTRINLGRIRLPRIHFSVFWPPSSRVAHTLSDMSHELFISRKWREGALESILTREMEGTDLSVLWEPIWHAHPAFGNPNWPWSENDKLPRVINRKRKGER